MSRLPGLVGKASYTEREGLEGGTAPGASPSFRVGTLRVSISVSRLVLQLASSQHRSWILAQLESQARTGKQAFLIQLSKSFEKPLSFPGLMVWPRVLEHFNSKLGPTASGAF